MSICFEFLTLQSFPQSQDPEEFAKLRKEYEAGMMTTMAKYIEEKIQANGGSLLVGKNPTMADLGLALTVKSVGSGNWDNINKGFFDAYTGIQ